MFSGLHGHPGVHPAAREMTVFLTHGGLRRTLSRFVRGRHVEEQLWHARIAGHFGMKGGDEEMSLAQQGRKAVALGENLDAGPHAGDAGIRTPGTGRRIGFVI